MTRALPVAVVIWLMIVPMLAKIDSAGLRRPSATLIVRFAFQGGQILPRPQAP